MFINEVFPGGHTKLGNALLNGMCRQVLASRALEDAPDQQLQADGKPHQKPEVRKRRPFPELKPLRGL